MSLRNVVTTAQEDIVAYIVELSTDSRCSEVATAIENRATAEGFSIEIIRASRRIQLRRVRRCTRGSRRGLHLSKEQWARFNELVDGSGNSGRIRSGKSGLSRKGRET